MPSYGAFIGDGTRYAWLADSDAGWNSNAVNCQGWTNWAYPVAPGDAFPGLSLFAVNTMPAAVPEPTALAMLAAGLMLVGWRSRRMS